MHKCLLGMKELAFVLGISKQALNYRIKAGKSWYDNDIPKAAYVIAASSVWTYEQIEARIKKANSYSAWKDCQKRLESLVHSPSVLQSKVNQEE